VTRVFVAVRIPDPVLDAVASRVSEIEINGRRATRDQWHLTLAFLGNDADPDAVAIALAGMRGPRGRARLGGAGAFPDQRRAQVLWLGLTEGADLVRRLAAEVAERVAPLGHAADPRPFRPHLTLARYRRAADVRELVAAFGDSGIGPAWEVDAITVYESRLRAEGAVYIQRAMVPVGAGPPST
jgi:2'-5' RNA ligase